MGGCPPADAPAEVRYLAQLQFILSEPVGRLLEQMPLLIRRLTTTTNTEVEISAQRIRGAIRWSETFAQRAATGLPHVFVTAPTRRAFDTPENRDPGLRAARDRRIRTSHWLGQGVNSRAGAARGRSGCRGDEVAASPSPYRRASEPPGANDARPRAR